MNVSVLRVIPMGLVAAGSVVRYRHNRRQKFLRECKETFGFPLPDRPLTRREWQRVDQVVKGLESRYERKRRLARAIENARPGSGQKHVDEAYTALHAYNHAVRLSKRIKRY